MWGTLVKHVWDSFGIYEGLHRANGLELTWKPSPNGNSLEIRRTSLPCVIVHTLFIETRVIHDTFRHRKSDESDVSGRKR